MKKVLILNGSPKTVSDTMVLTNSFIKGMTEEGFEAETINVIERDVAPCRGCLKCMENGEGRCLIDDDQNLIIEKIVSADVLIVSFPLYCYSMPSHLKAVIDRLLPLSRKTMTESGGRVLHDSVIKTEEKEYVIISGCGFPDWDGNFDAVRIMCRNLFRDPTMIFVSEAPLMNVPEAEPVSKPLAVKFRKAGREFAENGKLSTQTVFELETPMIPKEDYLRAVNGN